MGVSAAVVGAGAAVASAASSISKGSSASSQADAAGNQATADQQQALALWQQLQAPTLPTTPYQGDTWLQNYVPETYNPYIGTFTQMTDDPTSLAAENAALGQEQQFAKGGLQPADLVALQEIQQQQAGAGSSAAAQAISQLQAQGEGGAGASEAAMLSANQGAANNTDSLYQSAFQQALQRQVAAVGSAGTLAGNIRTQNDNVSQTMASNANQFNTEVQNLQTAAAANTANVENLAQAANLTGQQTTANEDVQTANQNADLSRAIAQQNFGNQDTIVTGQANALAGAATTSDASQSALSQQALGDSQQTTASLTGLAAAAKALSPTTTTNANGTTSTTGGSTPSWFSDIFKPSTSTSSSGPAATTYSGLNGGDSAPMIDTSGVNGYSGGGLVGSKPTMALGNPLFQKSPLSVSSGFSR